MENIDSYTSEIKREDFVVKGLQVAEPEFILGDVLEFTQWPISDTNNTERRDLEDKKLYADCKVYLERCDKRILYPHDPETREDDKNLLRELIAFIQPESNQELSNKNQSRIKKSYGKSIKEEPPAEADDLSCADDNPASKNGSLLSSWDSDGTSLKEKSPERADDFPNADKTPASKDDDTVPPTTISNGTNWSKSDGEQKDIGAKKLVEINESNSSIDCKDNVNKIISHTDDIFCKCVQCNELIHRSESKRPQKSKKQKIKHYECDLCHKEFSRPCVLKEHQDSKCGTLKLIGCSLCLKGFSTKKELQGHQRFTHKIGKINECKCDICEKTFAKNSTLKVHIREVHGKSLSKLVKCQSCNKSFSSNRLVNKHFHRVHRLHSYECSYCGNIYKQKQGLIIHIKNHMGIQNYKCSICKINFDTENRLKDHVATKSCSKKQFVCDICGKNMSTLVSLNNHILIHSDIKPFVCNNCGKSFRTDTNLAQHFVTHSDMRPYKCDICDKTFRIRNHLRQHMAVHGMVSSANYRKRNRKPIFVDSD